MQCPHCGAAKLQVLETRSCPDDSIFRRRRCELCGTNVRTLETMVDDVPRPQKIHKKKPGPRKGKKQPYANRALGESNGSSVLTAKDVKNLRLLAERGMLQKDIAVKFGISKETVSRIVNRKLWQHVP
jgi:transcriptional regulator NrdR family protein